MGKPLNPDSPSLNRMKFSFHSSQVKLKKILALEKDFTCRDLPDLISVVYKSAHSYVNYLHLVTKQIHIVDWVYYPSKKLQPTPLYRVGPGEDAPRPPKKSAAQRYKEFRLKKKLQAEEAGKELRDGRTKGIPRKPRCDIAASWITPIQHRSPQ